jgi:hypothetical protein
MGFRHGEAVGERLLGEDRRGARRRRRRSGPRGLKGGVTRITASASARAASVSRSGAWGSPSSAPTSAARIGSMSATPRSGRGDRRDHLAPDARPGAEADEEDAQAHAAVLSVEEAARPSSGAVQRKPSSTGMARRAPGGFAPGRGPCGRRRAVGARDEPRELAVAQDVAGRQVQGAVRRVGRRRGEGAPARGRAPRSSRGGVVGGNAQHLAPRGPRRTSGGRARRRGAWAACASPGP